MNISEAVEKYNPEKYARACCDTMMRKFEAAKLPPEGRFHYHQGVFLSGMYRTYVLTGDEKYYDYIKAWVDSTVDENGSIKLYDKGQMDDIEPGVLLFPIYERTGDIRYKRALDTLIADMENYPHNEDGGYWHKAWCEGEMWLDGLYMGGPITAHYGSAFEKPEWFDIVAEQVKLMKKHTEDKKTGLWRHAWDINKRAEWADPVTGQSPEFWGRSLGWVPMAILDDLRYIPKYHRDYDELVSIMKELLINICHYQSDEGRWYQVVDKGGEKGNWLENSCSCLFVAAICRAVKKGFLPESYLDAAAKGYVAVNDSLTWRGDDLIIENICIGTGVGDYDFYCARPTCENDLHGSGAYLLMCAAVMDVMGQ